MHRTATFLLSLLPPITVWADVACFKEAESRYRTPASLLMAISRVESGGNPNAVNCANQNRSCDYGHMQINSGWLRELQKYGITRQHLFDPCTNTHVAAWILADNIQRHGYSWRAVGAYNAKSRRKQDIYAHKVAAVLQKQDGVVAQ